MIQTEKQTKLVSVKRFLKDKNTGSHLWFHEEPLTSMETFKKFFRVDNGFLE